MRRVTLYVEDVSQDPEPGETYPTERYQFQADTELVLPLVFRAVSAAIGAHPDEITVLTTAMKVLSDAITVAAIAERPNLEESDG
jgi:hypothetical protein